MRYEIEDLISIFRLSEIEVLHIEGINFDVVNKNILIKAGKRRKKEGTEGELDVLAFSQNVVWVTEWTTSKWNSGHADSVTKDFDIFVANVQRLDQDRNLLTRFLKKVEAKFNKQLGLNAKACIVVGLYADPTLSRVDCKTLEQRIPQGQKRIFVWDSDRFEYFRVVSNTIRRFARYELFDHFGLEPDDVLEPMEAEYRRANVPFTAIKIGAGVFGHPTFTFKIKPLALLERSYVLRNEGWRSDSFQRMVNPAKLGGIRNYLIETGNFSFANNVIISPSSQTDPKEIFPMPISGVGSMKQGTVKINLPYRFGSFCILDGQHRLLAFTQDFYGEKDGKQLPADKKIKEMARTSEIIATLVLFEGDDREILRKQARLFRDINSNQTKVKRDFLYNLQEIIDPLHPESVGNRVIRYLNDLDNGAFENLIQIKDLPSYRGRIRRSSIVNYGLSDLVNPKGKFLATLFGKAVSEANLDEYVKFCGDKLDDYFGWIKDVFEKKTGKQIWGKWTKTGHMFLSTSAIVGFLRLYRHFLISGLARNKRGIKDRLEKINVDFTHEKYVYTSSQWAKLEAAMFKPIYLKFNDFGDITLLKAELVSDLTSPASLKQTPTIKARVRR